MASEDDDAEAISEEESNAGQDADAEDEDAYDGQRPEGPPRQEGTRRSTRAATPRNLWDPSSTITDGTEKLRTERQASYNQANLATATDACRKTAEPQSWREAVLSEDWLESMQREKDAKSADAYELTEHEPGMRVEHGIWRFRTKINQNGEVAKLKSRYVLDGSRQWSPFGREDTYSPVAEMSSMRTMLACAAEKGWKVIQADFTAAYLNVKLEEPVYVQQPPGTERRRKPNRLEAQSSPLRHEAARETMVQRAQRDPQEPRVSTSHHRPVRLHAGAREHQGHCRRVRG